MAIRAFEAHVRAEQPRTIVLDLSGEINSFAEENLNEAYAEAESKVPDVILLNFTNVDYINSTGIALIVGLLARARKNHRNLIACGLSEHYVEIFNITRLVDFMHVYPSEGAALAGKGA
jgi:anti-sigma B factor antagonist